MKNTRKKRKNYMSSSLRSRLTSDPYLYGLWRKLVRIADYGGTRIDKGIRETVLYCWALGLSTEGSCQGHPYNERYRFDATAPYLIFSFPAPPDVDAQDIYDHAHRVPGRQRLRDVEQTIARWVKENFRLQWKVLALLGAFYQDRVVPEDVRLVIQPISRHGDFDLTNQGELVLESLTKRQQNRKLKRYQAEVTAWTGFLRHRYEQGEQCSQGKSLFEKG